MEYYVYILTNNKNKVLYIGVTNDLLRRVNQHKKHINKGFTNLYLLNKLVYYEQTSDVNVAIMREKQLKAGSRKKKIDLINSFNPNWKDLYFDYMEEDDEIATSSTTPRNDN